MCTCSQVLDDSCGNLNLQPIAPHSQGSSLRKEHPLQSAAKTTDVKPLQPGSSNYLSRPNNTRALVPLSTLPAPEIHPRR